MVQVAFASPISTTSSKRYSIEAWKSKNPKKEPEWLLKPGEKPTEFEIMVYKIHFIRIDNLGYKLKLASLYMQATEGPNTTPEPPKEDHHEHSYWTAWKQLGKMTKVLFTNYLYEFN